MTTTVPTAEQKGGDFSKTFNDDGTLQQIFNPFDVHEDADGNWIRAPFAGNVIPGSLFDPVARNIMALYPDPMGPGDPITGRHNYTKKLVNSYPGYQFDIKIDYVMTAKTHISGRYSRAHSTGSTPSAEGQLLDAASNRGNDQNIVLEYNWSPTPTILWNNRLGVDRSYYRQAAAQLDPASVGFPPDLNSYLAWNAFRRLALRNMDIWASRAVRIRLRDKPIGTTLQRSPKCLVHTT